MAANSKSSGGFTGVFTLRTPEEAQRLADAVRAVVDKSVNIFFTIDKNPTVAQELIQDIETVCSLSATFPPLCSMDDTYVHVT
jgi:plasmid stabilization system protein ParE